ncbi:2-phospho-L-lactate guanylyltransferase [Halorussus salinisoli]|uniref:2-phospho-L-lactate guanylyltransferase n=1 Tax=Halorussus salinisoli TaxID=2558242 RepID=UPI0010C16D7D|nr:2-phospho-L-lactate guanylyltransferase [Halorussus salinisoli]
MRVVVPFDPRDPKTRLDAILDEGERREFARAMLTDVVEAIGGTDITPEVLTTTPIDVPGAATLVDERPLSQAVNAVLDVTSEPTAVVMADVPLLTPSSCSRLFEAAGEVVLARGMGGGTNALVTRHSDFRVDYHGASYLDHLEVAERYGASVTELDSYRFSVDIDEPGDVSEVLLHGHGETYDWLRNAGFRLDTGDGRVAVERVRESNDVETIST